MAAITESVKSSIQPQSCQIQSLDSDVSFSSSVFSVASCVGKSIQEMFIYFYNNNLFTDVIINVRCGESHISFPCHKLVLSVRSPVFASKFYGKHTSECEELEVSDVPPSAFEAMIKYCYNCKEELNRNRSDVNFLLKVIKAAKLYEIKSLEVECCQMFSSALPTIYNVFELLDAAVLTNSENLRLRCFKVLQTQTGKALSTWDISSVTPAVINTILDMDELALNSEYDLISWLFEWGSHAFSKAGGSKESFQEKMQPYLLKVNFLSLTPKEFQMLVKKNPDFFTPSDGFAIFMNIIEPGCEDLPSWCSSEKIDRSFVSARSEYSSIF